MTTKTARRGDVFRGWEIIIVSLFKLTIQRCLEKQKLHCSRKEANAWYIENGKLGVNHITLSTSFGGRTYVLRTLQYLFLLSL
jgi:hypothetical protein